MRKKKSTEIIAMLSASAALLAAFLVSCEWPPSIDRRLHSDIGKALAKEALGLLGPQGKITVITRDTDTFGQPAIVALFESFKREVRQANATIAATQFVQTDPLRPVDVPSGDFFELIRRSAPEHVIVSFLGPPLLTEEQRSQLGRVKPKIVAFCPGSLSEHIDLRQLSQAGLLHAALISRPASSIAQNATGPPLDLINCTRLLHWPIFQPRPDPFQGRHNFRSNANGYSPEYTKVPNPYFSLHQD